MNEFPGDGHGKHRLRTLVVDNNTEIRELHKELLELWGHTAIVAESLGQRLLADAVHKAREYRCQLALVDVHLLDDYDPVDRSGLDLIKQLRPARSIVVSGSDDRRLVRDALVQKSAINFVGKEDGPVALKEAIDDAIKKYRLGVGHLQIEWPHNPLSVEQLIHQFGPTVAGIPLDETEEVLTQLFPKAHKLVLEPAVPDDPVGERTSTLRRRSRIYLTQVDNGFSRYVTKITRSEKLRIENERYKTYVNNKLDGDFYPIREGKAVFLWDLGGIIYRRVGAPALNDSDPPMSFREYFELAPTNLTQPLIHLFKTQWGRYYTAITPSNRTLLESYDQCWVDNALKPKLPHWSKEAAIRRFEGLRGVFPNPRRWLFDHQHEMKRIELREAITHGDLHADNLFVNTQHAWPIDFERTGPGPVLRDPVELMQDVLTRLVPRSDPGVVIDLRPCYFLYIAVCLPIGVKSTPANYMPRELIGHDLYVRGIHLAYEMQQLIGNVMNCSDLPEYYWGLLLNNLFVAELLGEQHPRWAPTMLFASILCKRLEQMTLRSTNRWPPTDWTAITWLGIHEFTKLEEEARLTRPNPSQIATTIIYGDIKGNVYSGAYSADGSESTDPISPATTPSAEKPGEPDKPAHSIPPT